MKRRRWLLRAGIALVALLAAHGALWWIVTDRMLVALFQQIAVANAQGWRVIPGAPHRDGWPLAAQVSLDGIDITDPAGRLGWHSGDLRLRLDPRRPSRLALDLGGAHALRLAEHSDIPIAATRIAATVTLFGTPAIADAVIRDLRAVVQGGTTRIATLDLRATYVPAAPRDTPAITLTGTAHGIDLPAYLAPSFDRRIAMIELDATLSGPLPADPLTTSPRTMAADWHAGDGRLTVARLSFDWGKLEADASADLALDALLQPSGAGTMRLTGVADTIDALVRAAILPAGTGRAAKAVLMLMARDADGAVQLGATLNDRTLTISQFPLARLPQTLWPERW